MKYSDEQRIEKILKYALKLQDYIVEDGVTEDKLLTEEKLQWLVTTPLYNIGEHSYNLSKEFKDSHTYIEWDNISALRHRLVHDYEGINWKIVSDVILKDLPVLTKQLQELVKNQPNGILDRFGSDKIEIQRVQEEINRQKEYDARLNAIRDVDLSVKPKTNAEKLQQFCKKALMQHYTDDYNGYMIEGVKSFLLSTPNVKLEQMTKLIEVVTPVVAFDSEKYRYSEFVKDTIRQDEQFRKLLANRGKTPKEILR